MISILFIVALGAVITAASVIISQQRCPEESELRKYKIGRMNKDGAAARRITGHLGICEECRKRVLEET